MRQPGKVRKTPRRPGRADRFHAGWDAKAPGRGTPTPDQRLDPSDKSKEWRVRLSSAVSKVINDRAKAIAQRAEAEKDRDQARAAFADRASWIKTAQDIAGLVAYATPIPPTTAGTLESAVSLPWRDGLVAQVRQALDKRGSPVAGSSPSVQPSLQNEVAAEAEFLSGWDLSDRGQFGPAEQAFSRGGRLLPAEPKFAYFRALALHDAGRTAEAELAARQGAALEWARGPATSSVDGDLIRVQGPRRLWLESFRTTGHAPVGASW